MFGHDDAQNSQGKPNEPVDDGTLGVPMPDDDMRTPPAPPADNDDSMRPDEPSLTLPPSSPRGGNAPLSGAADDLINIKQEALQQLKPLVNHLDQTPEEKFRTTMMMIQAVDDHSLIKEAYDAALQIGSEKERAQALLDIVNEINYFTQNDQAA